jgi:hypothetical protein
MKEQIDSIIKKHCLKMQEVDKTKSIPMTVKELDIIVYSMYRELYGLRDIRADNYCLNTFTADNKKGHCS